MINKFMTRVVFTTILAGLSACGANKEATQSVDIKSEQSNTVSHPYPEMEAAARAGNAKAQFNMGILFDEGAEVEEDDEKAAFWYKMAAEQDFPPALMSLGEMYQKGLGVDENFETAMNYYQSAAVKGNVDAQLTLGLIYQSKKTGPFDQKISANWFRAAAQQGNALGMTRLGAKFADGKGVETDLEKAFIWSTLGARYGNKEAEINVEKISEKMKNTDIIQAKDLAEVCLNSGFRNCD